MIKSRASLGLHCVDLLHWNIQFSNSINNVQLFLYNEKPGICRYNIKQYKIIQLHNLITCLAIGKQGFHFIRMFQLTCFICMISLKTPACITNVRTTNSDKYLKWQTFLFTIHWILGNKHLLTLILQELKVISLCPVHAVWNLLQFNPFFSLHRRKITII